MTPLQQFEAILATPGVIGFDVETTIDRAAKRQLCTVQAAHEDGREVMVYVYNQPDLIGMVAQAITASPARLVAHFAVFEWEMCHKIGARPKDMVCTYVAARCLHGAMVGSDNLADEEYGGWALEDLARGILGINMDKTLQKSDWTQPLTPASIEYGLQDARIARDLWFVFEPEFAADPDAWNGFAVVNDAIPAIASCNQHGGLVFDKVAHKALCVRLESGLRAHTFEMDLISRDEIANHGSGKQVSDWISHNLFDDPEDTPLRASLKFFQCTEQNWGLTATDQLSLAKGTVTRILELVEMVNPDVGEYLRVRAMYQQEAKLVQAFGAKLAEAVDDDGCIRGSFIPHGARTSRGSMRDPNLQQMPVEPEFRQCFKARKGRKLVIADYGQIELRTGCIIADDKRMQLVFKEGFDIHAATAVAVFALGAYDPDNPAHKMLRKKAKAPNFAALYGAEEFAIALATGMTMSEARAFLDKWLGVYPGIDTYRRRMPEIGRQQGYIQLVSGQKIKVVEDTRPAQMINGPVQGGSASVMYRAATRVWRRLEEEDLDAYLTLLVHDELIVDAAEECAVRAAHILQEEMVEALLHFFPLAAELGLDNVADASICDNWAQKDDDNYKLERYIERMGIVA